LTAKQTVRVVHEMKVRWGSSGIAPLILYLRARHIVWSMSCCSQSPCPHPEEITSDTHHIGGWASQSWSDVLRREKSIAPEGIRNPDCPALSLVTRLTTVLSPFKKTEVQTFMGVRQL